MLNGKNYFVIFLFPSTPEKCIFFIPSDTRSNVKRTSWVDINLGLLFCMIEAVYSADHDLIFLQNFQIFKIVFYKHFKESRDNPCNTLCVHLKDG